MYLFKGKVALLKVKAGYRFHTILSKLRQLSPRRPPSQLFFRPSRLSESNWTPMLFRCLCRPILLLTVVSMIILDSRKQY